ncbi:hypothetical protein D5272_08155 [bacterium D16-76]|nr:hypothetical protein [bacterium D16-76]
MAYTEAFDYKRMAWEAERERDVLQGLLARRRAQRPMDSQQELAWRQEVGMLYTMYLEQRGKAKDLARRAQKREGVSADGRRM